MTDKKTQPYKPIVGEELFLVKTSSYQKKAPSTFPCKVIKVGRKYFSVEWTTYYDFQGERRQSAHVGEFYIEDWREYTNSSSYLSLFTDDQAYRDEKDRLRWEHRFLKIFGGYGRRKRISLAQYQRAAKILNIELGGED